jgi:hypothetical protein
MVRMLGCTEDFAFDGDPTRMQEPKVFCPRREGMSAFDFQHAYWCPEPLMFRKAAWRKTVTVERATRAQSWLRMLTSESDVGVNNNSPVYPIKYVEKEPAHPVAEL